MTDTLKTVLVDALNAAETTGDDFFYIGKSIASDIIYSVDHVTLDADRLATAVRDHFLDREKVSDLLADVLDNYSHRSEAGFNLAVDRLIAGLSGGSE